MIYFLICGVLYLIYAFLTFKKTKTFFPSIIFSFMWGINCIFTSLILLGLFDNMYLEDFYVYNHMDTYIIFFTITSLFAFYWNHKDNKIKIKIQFSLTHLEKILDTYSWIMWLNFFGGLLRIVLMIQLVGFNSMMDYRLAANDMMMTSGSGFVGLVFRLTAYVQLLTNFYVTLAGFNTGYKKINLHYILKIFILYAPTQMATGGRLFILYFIIFFFGSFLLGRGISIENKSQSLFSRTEIRALAISFIGLLALVSIIAMARQSEGNINEESAIAKFSYITEGMLATEHCMSFYEVDSFKPDYGEYLLKGNSETMSKFREELFMTRMSNIVYCIITPLYIGFGYWGSLIVWFFIAFLVELLSIRCLNKLTIINLPVIQLIILLAIFYKPIFGRLNK